MRFVQETDERLKWRGTHLLYEGSVASLCSKPEIPDQIVQSDRAYCRPDLGLIS